MVIDGFPESNHRLERACGIDATLGLLVLLNAEANSLRPTTIA